VGPVAGAGSTGPDSEAVSGGRSQRREITAPQGVGHRGRRPAASDRGESLQPGSPLPSESELVTTYGFSRSTIREALRLLETNGLIRIKRGPGGGITVGRPDETHVTESLALVLGIEGVRLRDLFDVRKLLEPPAAALAAANADETFRASMAAFADGSRQTSPRTGDWIEFHHLVARASGNSVLRVLHSVIQEIVRWHSAAEVFAPEDLVEVDRAHRVIAGHILAGRSERAEAAMLTHLAAYESRMDEVSHLDDGIVPRSRWQDDG
jgi:GntR family transcriptional repressor for pyruvate dehydrogenase complex